MLTSLAHGVDDVKDLVHAASEERQAIHGRARRKHLWHACIPLEFRGDVCVFWAHDGKSSVSICYFDGPKS